MENLIELEKEKRLTESHPSDAHLKVFPFKCPSCKKTNIFWFNGKDSWDNNALIVCSNCRHLWMLDMFNPSKRND